MYNLLDLKTIGYFPFYARKSPWTYTEIITNNLNRNRMAHQYSGRTRIINNRRTSAIWPSQLSQLVSNAEICDENLRVGHLLDGSGHSRSP